MSDPSTVHAQLVTAAKKMIIDHWPGPDGCPICKVHNCEARTTAYRYLDEHAGPAPAPIIPPDPR
ncbi:hypothetical protein [Micromonospora zhanjiangensis]|uniref:HNH endonuclease n=1 Tax=Micromonospora zhanjiangensis TaxID=1522057 RepID=A0ABV8KV29_9ACTN